MEQVERIGRYVVEGLLGRGTMGTVYLAHDPIVDRRVALKVVRTTAGGRGQEAARQRFLREVRAAGRLSHPNIVTIFDVGDEPELGLAYIAMDYLEGRTLAAEVAGGRVLTPAEAVALVATLARALDYAHRKGVVHRDVKPANVILTAGGEVKLTDFGVARLDTSELTVEGTLLGTPAYMSPEQINGRAVDGRSDLFSLGVVLFELLTGSRPFAARSLPELSLAVTRQPPPDPRSLRGNLPPALGAAVLRCLAKRPEERFQDGVELAEALEGLDLEQGAGDGPVFAEPVAAQAPPLNGSVFSALSGTGPDPVAVETLPTVLAPRTAARLRRRRAALAGAVVAVAAGLAGIAALRLLAPGTEPVPPADRMATATATPLAPTPTATATATVELVHRNRLGSADMSVWVDDSLLWSTRVGAARNPLARIRGEELRHALTVPAGAHRITVHIRGRSMEVDARAAVEAELRPAERRTLRVTLNPYSEKATLTWED